jgi:C4-dicarboxylate-specific signal transduction histidine kinase
VKGIVAIMAPTGRDGAVICQILTAGVIKREIVSPDMLVAGLAQGEYSAAVLTEEAVNIMPIAELQLALVAQEAWSDFPFIILISKGEAPPGTAAKLKGLGNVSLVERPMHPATLLGAVRSALRARQRQREAQNYICARAEAERQLRRLAETLEERVLERTQALSEANSRLQLEMTARLDAQDRLDAMQGELIHISRVSAMGTMASTLAHELNQPLAAVMNYVVASRHLLAQAIEPTSPKILAALDAARANAHEASEIVRRLRDLVARGQVKTQREYLPTLINDALKLGLIDAGSTGACCETTLDPAAFHVLVDRVQIQQVLINLVRNAIEAMQHCPTKVISISSRQLDDEMVEVSVADTGPGIDPAALAVMFSPFNTTKSDGLGIGLSISRTIVEANGGSITGENAPDGGAIFRFTMRGPDSPSGGEDPQNRPMSPGDPAR